MSFEDRYRQQGWLRIGGIFDVALIDELRAEFDRQYDALVAPGGGHRGYLNVGDERMMLSVRLQGPFLDERAYANPILLTVLRQLLGPNLLIDNYTCVIALPGAAEQHFHRDHNELFPEQAGLDDAMPPFAITAVIPLIDLTPETGTTKLFPGAFQRPPEDSDAFELPYVQRGDCFLMDYRLHHRGMPNTSNQRRPILYVVYSRPWFTDMRNFHRQPRINIGRDDFARILPEHRAMFRRVAGKGLIDLSEKELFAEGPSVAKE